MHIKSPTPVSTFIYTDYVQGEGRWTKSIAGESIDTIEIEKMCSEYPTLDKAYRNFINVYSMCVDDFNKRGE
tara:strand:- start:324 stop:539 length:216 start_codon:yes stop_codon:yes gene_type:complete